MGITKSVPQKRNHYSFKGLTSSRKSEYEVILIAFSSCAFSFCFGSWLTKHSESLGTVCFLSEEMYWLADSFISPLFIKDLQRDKNLLKTHGSLLLCLNTKRNFLAKLLRTRKDRGDQDDSLEIQMPLFLWLLLLYPGDEPLKMKRKSWILHIKFRELSIVY